MLDQKARPMFGGKLMQPEYYVAVRTYAESMRATTTHRQIANNLNAMGYRSPSGKPWVRQTVANVLRKTAVK